MSVVLSPQNGVISHTSLHPSVSSPFAPSSHSSHSAVSVVLSPQNVFVAEQVSSPHSQVHCQFAKASPIGLQVTHRSSVGASGIVV